MVKDLIISSTTFINYLNSPITSRVTVVRNAKEKIEGGEDNPYDYWSDFKRVLIKVLKANGTKEDLREVIEIVRDEMRPNYQEMVDGFIKFWGRKQLEWIKPSKKVVSFGGLKVRINPEIGLRIKGTEYYIKLLLKANEIIDRKHADLVTSIMEYGLRKQVGDKVIFAVLDVRRGKLHASREVNYQMKALLKTEGTSFLNLWEEL